MQYSTELLDVLNKKNIYYIYLNQINYFYLHFF